MKVEKTINRRSFLKQSMLCFLVGGIDFLETSFFSSPKKLSRPGFAGTKAMFYTRLKDNLVNCRLCFRQCFIADGKRGFCRVRENRGGELHSLVYGRPAGLQIDPIELEPMYHLVPAHKNICVYTASCNFRCKHCHNWHISQFPPEEIKSSHLSPVQIVEEAIKQGCRSISHSINEPTVFYEMVLEVNQLAKKKGLLTLIHTNGGMAKAPMSELLKSLDGVTVDLKAFNLEFYEKVSEAKLEPVLETLKTIKEAQKHLEIVNLIIPTLNDDLDDIKKMCRWIVDHLGKDTPLHFTRFSPSYKLTHLPRTPIKILEEARSIAQREGLRFVYIGNVTGHPGNSTYCPECGEKLIERTHFLVLKNQIKKGCCPFCGETIPGIWE